jgi:hypothetical protein
MPNKGRTCRVDGCLRPAEGAFCTDHGRQYARSLRRGAVELEADVDLQPELLEYECEDILIAV